MSGVADELRALASSPRETARPRAKSPPSAMVLDPPASLSEDAFWGLAGEIVGAVSPVTEADPAALVFVVLACFGSAAGPATRFRVGADRHAPNLFIVQVGSTAGGRKGTAWGAVVPIFEAADRQWATSCIRSGASTGEGLVHAIRDPTVKRVAQRDESGDLTGDYVEEITDPGVEDKRLLDREDEFAAVLRMMQRKQNTLSTTIRMSFDNKELQFLTKGQPEKATSPHIAIVADVTPEELRMECDEISAVNGFLNRFMLVHTQRSKLRPFGGYIDNETLQLLANKVRKALVFAKQSREIDFAPDTRHAWRFIYERLTEDNGGVLGALLARGVSHVLRMAIIYALMDECREIQMPHLRAALGMWKYAEESAAYIYADSVGDRLAQKILTALRNAGANGLSRSELHRTCARGSHASRIDAALKVLVKRDLAVSTKLTDGQAGRPMERWHASNSEGDTGGVNPNGHRNGAIPAGVA